MKAESGKGCFRCEPRSYLPGDADWDMAEKGCGSEPFQPAPSGCECRRLRASSLIPDDRSSAGGIPSSSLPGDFERVDALSLRLDGIAGRVAADYEYSYDPGHESKPEGPGWQKTDKGWSRDTAPHGQAGDDAGHHHPGHAQEKVQAGHRKPEDLKHRRHLSKADLTGVLNSGKYSIISGGQNGEDEKEKGMGQDDPFFHDRHLSIRDELEDAGLDYTEVVGVYGGKESSFIVFHDSSPPEMGERDAKSFVVHHGGHERDRIVKALDALGEKYNQNSVLHGGSGRNELHFTTGANKGQSCWGEGWKQMEGAENFYTEVPLDGHEFTRIQVDLRDCFERKMIAMISRLARRVSAYNDGEDTYRWDPKHHNRPPAGAWRRTDRGWSRVLVPED